LLFPQFPNQRIQAIQYQENNNDIDIPGKIMPPNKYIEIGDYCKDEKGCSPENKLFFVSGGYGTNKPVN